MIIRATINKQQIFFGKFGNSLTLLRLGGVKFTWPTQNFNFQWETALQTPQKPPDFLYFDLTDPMVPNLADVFILGWISGTDSRGAYQAKMAIFSYFDIFAQVSNLSYILPSKYYATQSSEGCLYLYQEAYNINFMAIWTVLIENLQGG